MKVPGLVADPTVSTDNQTDDPCWREPEIGITSVCDFDGRPLPVYSHAEPNGRVIFLNE